jgi:general secretion pathway protein F
MAAFEYQALDPSGSERKGILQGDTARQARAMLREQGLTPPAVEAVREHRRAGPRMPGFRSRLNGTDLALVTRQLATLSEAGIPLEEALGTCVEQIERPAARRIIAALRGRVMEGHSLAGAMAEFPGSFPELYRATVGAGEESGHLDRVLSRLADYTEARQNLARRTALALLYPAILTMASVAVVGVLLGYVVPQLVQVFESLDTTLPLATRILLAVSGFVGNHGLLLAAGIAAALAAFALGLRSETFRYRVHGLILRLPVAGRLARGAQTARFARTLSILTASGVPVLEGLRISAQVVGNLPMRTAIRRAAEQVREGASLNRALAETRQFPPMTLQLIASGERSGRLEQMLERAAVNAEREVETLTAAFMGALEPLLILFVGMLVLFIVLAILLPIFQLNQLVS